MAHQVIAADMTTLDYGFDHGMINVPEAQAQNIFMNYETLEDKLGLNDSYLVSPPTNTIKLAKRLDPREIERSALTKALTTVRMEDLDSGTGRIVGRSSPFPAGHGPMLYSNTAAREQALAHDSLQRLLEGAPFCGVHVDEVDLYPSGGVGILERTCCATPNATHCADTNEPHVHQAPAPVRWYFQPPQHHAYSMAIFKAAPVSEGLFQAPAVGVDPWNVSLFQEPPSYRKRHMAQPAYSGMPGPHTMAIIEAASSRAVPGKPAAKKRGVVSPRKTTVSKKTAAVKKSVVAGGIKKASTDTRARRHSEF